MAFSKDCTEIEDDLTWYKDGALDRFSSGLPSSANSSGHIDRSHHTSGVSRNLNRRPVYTREDGYGTFESGPSSYPSAKFQHQEDNAESEMETDEDVDAKEMLSDETKIRRNYVYLKDEIDPKYIVDVLFENNIITDNEKEEICIPNKARHKQMGILLKILLRKSSFEHGSFLLIMKNHYKHVVETLAKTTDFIKRDEMQDLKKWIGRIKHSKKYLSKTINPTSTCDFLVQELPESEFSLDMHDKILHENRTVCGQANLALDFIIETRISSILSCFLESLTHAQHNRRGEEIIAILMEADSCKHMEIDVKFQKSFNPKKEDLHGSTIRMRIEGSRDLEEEITNEINTDTRIEEITNKMLHLSIKNAHLGSVVITVKPLTENALQVLDSNRVKLFLHELFSDMDINFPEEGLNIRFEVFIGCDEKCKAVKDRNISELDENKALLLDELEPLRLVECAKFKKMLSDDEIQQIKSQRQRRQRVSVFLEMVEQRGRIGLETLLQELKSKNEEYILSKWVSNSKMLNATQKENLRRCILENFEKIADDIDETISSLTIKAQDERSYKSGSFVLSQALKCDKTLVRFYCAAKGTRIERLTRSAPARLRRKKIGYRFPGMKNYKNLLKKIRTHGYIFSVAPKKSTVPEQSTKRSTKESLFTNMSSKTHFSATDNETAITHSPLIISRYPNRNPNEGRRSLTGCEDILSNARSSRIVSHTRILGEKKQVHQRRKKEPDDYHTHSYPLSSRDIQTYDGTFEENNLPSWRFQPVSLNNDRKRTIHFRRREKEYDHNETRSYPFSGRGDRIFKGRMLSSWSSHPVLEDHWSSLKHEEAEKETRFQESQSGIQEKSTFPPLNIFTDEKQKFHFHGIDQGISEKSSLPSPRFHPVLEDNWSSLKHEEAEKETRFQGSQSGLQEKSTISQFDSISRRKHRNVHKGYDSRAFDRILPFSPQTIHKTSDKLSELRIKAGTRCRSIDFTKSSDRYGRSIFHD